MILLKIPRSESGASVGIVRTPSWFHKMDRRSDIAIYTFWSIGQQFRGVANRMINLYILHFYDEGNKT